MSKDMRCLEPAFPAGEKTGMTVYIHGLPISINSRPFEYSSHYERLEILK